ncbi:Thaumatin family [Musa troglodytarum]|uniref:Thaumatin family n=1 Tax=Musa troglodytarum TaxID=320322 RepID=A0A9E7HEZ7_9LILI|nr:Thaumatin family [Musa troglodytarum]
MAQPRLVSLAFFVAILISGAHSATFGFKNNCPFTIWPASSANADKAALSQTGFQLDSGASFSLDAPPAWGGRLWARQTCSTDSAGKFSCITGDCGTGQVACNGNGGAPPTTLVEFTLQGDGGKDFYDVSCVDGFNLPVLVVPSGGSNCESTSCPVNVNAQCPQELQVTAPDGGVVGCKSACVAFNTDEYCCRGHGGSNCNSTSCPVNVNAQCPQELQVTAPDGGVVGCKSACLAFNTDEYCCRGQYDKPDTCKPSDYSKIFKNACPQAYSYAYDDRSSTFTCVGANYDITFCP